MATMPQEADEVTVGVGTHAEVHVAAVVDARGLIQGTREFTTTQAGYRELVRFAKSFGHPRRFGVEGTGTYGAGLARYLHGEGLEVLEVERPNRQRRRRLGKSDPIDAEAAARAVLSGEATAAPKTRDGRVEMIRVLRVARRSAVRGRTQCLNQIRSLITTAPEDLRAQLRNLTEAKLLARLLGLRPGSIATPSAATKLALRQLARRHHGLGVELSVLDAELGRLVAEAAPCLLELKGVGVEVAGQLLVTAGDNPERLRSESSFAHLCGVAPLPASSGKTVRHRLNRGGDRGANQALWRVVIVRLSCEERTRSYLARRQTEGLSKREAIRCLKRYVAREVWRCLVDGQ